MQAVQMMMRMMMTKISEFRPLKNNNINNTTCKEPINNSKSNKDLQINNNSNNVRFSSLVSNLFIASEEGNAGNNG